MQAKGPVGVAVPVLTMVTTLWLLRSDKPDIRRYAVFITVALAIGVAAFAAWGVAANNATHGEFLRKGLGHHVLARSVKPLETHGGGFVLYLPYYIPAVLCGFFPWSLYLPAAISALVGGRLGDGRFRALILGWTVPTFVLMTLVQTKLPHYVLPIYPALALVVAATVDLARRDGLAERDRRWLRRGAWGFGVVSFGGAIGLCAGPWFLPARNLVAPCAVVGALVAALALWVLRQTAREDHRGAVVSLVCGTVALSLATTLIVYPALERVKISARVAAAIRRRAGPEVPVFTHGYDEPGVVYYLFRPPEQVIRGLDSAEQVASWAREKGPGVLVITSKRLRRIQTKGGELPLARIASVAGLNYATGKWLDVLVLGRDLPVLVLR